MAFWALRKAKFLPAAQPWWAAGCAVTGVGGQGEKMLYSKMSYVGVYRGVWAKTN